MTDPPPQGKQQSLLQRIISGGQTGVDRAALDVGLELQVPVGGWCPLGRRAEDGRIPEAYPLTECPSRNYAVRTEWNVRDSDGTLILAGGQISGGTRLTQQLARRHRKPLLVIQFREPSRDLLFSEANSDDEITRDIVAWITKNRIRVLNVAGPRASSCAQIYDRAVVAITRVCRQVADGVP